MKWMARAERPMVRVPGADLTTSGSDQVSPTGARDGHRVDFYQMDLP